jgi:organic radical activating enzyme
MTLPLPKLYPIHERFYSFQGEGDHMGKSAFFIRTYGCPVHCPWCDAAGTWHPHHVPRNIDRMSASDLAAEVVKERPAIVVITGGEPAVHDLSDLVKRIKETADVPVHLETSGSFPIEGAYDWITLSPKKWRHPLPANVVHANEFKLIIEHPNDITHYYSMLLALGLTKDSKKSIWLHPEWTQRNNLEVKEAIVTFVKAGSSMFRAGWQMHKLYLADLQDSRTQPMVPIGGDPNKGF